jgi:hypothetical protein
MDRIADRLIETRARTWEDTDGEGRELHRTLGFAHLGGATLDNEENYLRLRIGEGSQVRRRASAPAAPGPRRDAVITWRG